MTSEFVRNQVEALLNEAGTALRTANWSTVQAHAQTILALDPENADAKALLVAAERAVSTRTPSTKEEPTAAINVPSTPQPTSFAHGRYTVKRFLGEGGKKKVYLAHDAMLDRDVAFALIKTEGLDDAGRARVNREAQSMGRLGSHPNIVTVYDIGEENNQPYLVLPILSGGDVEGIIEKAPEHRLPLEQALKIAIETCQGLELAHSKGIVHRDLKPGNVWLTEDGRAMIGDFGLAVAADRSRLTQAGMMVGTVSYMPPEQAMGGEVGPRSDLYSLGAMLYEMVCGRPPFVGDESVAIIGQHLNTPPVAPTWHRPDCPPALETLILRLLEKDPSKRPTSVTEVRQALESINVATAGAHDPAIAAEVPPTGDNPLYRRTFVGRENEVKQLQAAFDAALSGQGGLVMVVGEPGIGKTALCEQLATYVALRGGKALVGHCYEEGSLSLPYLAFVEAMRSYVLARDPDGLRSDLGTGAADVARIVSDVRDRVQGVELRPNGDPEDDRWRLLQAITGFIRNASTVQPLCIVLEDLHWADRGTLDLLLHVSRNLQGARLLIVCTYRDVEVDRLHPLSGVLAEMGRAATFHRIRLRGLTIDEVQRMMAGVAQREVSWALAELIHRQTEGNPLFIQEMLRYLVEEGLLSEHDGALRRVGDEPLAGRIPEGLRDVIGKRLSRLTAECNRLLAIAAVIGRDFRLDTLHTVAGVDEEGLVTALEEATRIGVLEEQARTGVITYRFTHAFFRQTLYEELSAPRRLRFHQEVARALEAQYATRRQEHAAELAEHFSNSTDQSDLAKAVEYGELASTRAMSVFDYGEAVRLLEKTIDVQEVLDRDDKLKRCDLLLALAKALTPAGKPLRVAEEIAEEAFLLAEALSERQHALSACLLSYDALLAYGAGTMGGTSLSGRWAERADRYAAPETAERVWADAALAAVRTGQRRYSESWALKNTALTLARRFNEPEGIWRAALTMFGNPNSVPVRQWRAVIDLADEFAAVPDDSVNVRTVARAMSYMAFVILASGDRGKAEGLWERGAVIAANSHDPELQLTPFHSKAIHALLDGELEAAVDAGARVVVEAEQLGSPVWGLQMSDRLTFEPLCYLGRYEEALALLPRASVAAGLDGISMISTLRMALCRAQLGQQSGAKLILRQAILDLGLDSTDDATPATILDLLLQVAVLLRDKEITEVLLARLNDLTFLAGMFPSVNTCIGRHLGDAAVMLKRPDEARKYYAQALEICEKVRFRPEIALLRLDLAELLLEHHPDERGAALEHLDFAIAELRDMKMQPALERALRHRGLLKA